MLRGDHVERRDRRATVDRSLLIQVYHLSAVGKQLQKVGSLAGHENRPYVQNKMDVGPPSRPAT